MQTMKTPTKIAITTALLALALPGAAEAAKIKHEGKIDGEPGSTVGFAVKKEHGELTRVTAMSFRDVPVTCTGGVGGTVTGLLPGFSINGNDFDREGTLEGRGIEDGELRVDGEFDRGGREASGGVRFSFHSSATGADCRTGKVAWKTARER